MLTKEEIQILAGDTDAMLKEIVGWEDCELFHVQNFPNGAMALETQFFNVVKAYGVTNMDKPNEVIYPTIIGEIGVDLRGSIADLVTFITNAEMVIVKDNREYATWPLCCLPSGGGTTKVLADGTAATALQSVTHGIDARMHGFYAAISFIPQQTLRVIIRTTGAALAAQAGIQVKPLLRGLQARNPV